MGMAGILGLVVIFVPSFIVSPGLIQKTFGARSPAAAARAALGNAAALALFAFVPAILGMAMRAVEPGLSNAEMALPRLTMDVLPPWLGGLGLAALFAAELSSADAILFMLSTSLSRDLYQAVLRPEATDAQLLRAGRGAAVAGGVVGLILAMVLPSVVAALKIFYGIMTAALFVPLMVGLFSSRPGAGQARAAIVLSVVGTGAGLLVLRGAPAGSWAPSVMGMTLALVAFATAWLPAVLRSRE
jgi:SSS family solute:Na+ symporter